MWWALHATLTCINRIYIYIYIFCEFHSAERLWFLTLSQLPISSERSMYITLLQHVSRYKNRNSFASISSMKSRIYLLQSFFFLILLIISIINNGKNLKSYKHNIQNTWNYFNFRTTSSVWNHQRCCLEFTLWLFYFSTL